MKKEKSIEKSQPSEQLTSKVSDLKQIINIHDLLNRGHFEGHTNVRIGEGLQFLTRLHAELLEEVTSDPEAHLIPELEEVMKNG